MQKRWKNRRGSSSPMAKLTINGGRSNSSVSVPINQISDDTLKFASGTAPCGTEVHSLGYLQTADGKIIIGSRGTGKNGFRAMFSSAEFNVLISQGLLDGTFKLTDAAISAVKNNQG